MAKVSNRYLEVDPFKIIEKGFHKDRSQVSESIFSIGNEYSGIRGFFEEGITGVDSLIGSYFNGIYEYALEDTPSAYKGIAKRSHFTINSVNYAKCRIKAGEDILDLGNSKYTDFTRTLDMRSGLLKRKFTWKIQGAQIEIEFERLLDMNNCYNALQRITFKSDKDIDIHLSLSLDSNVLHWGNHCYWEEDKVFKKDGNQYGISVKTPTTHQSLVSVMRIDSIQKEHSHVIKDKEISVHYNINLIKDKKFVITRYVVNLVDKRSDEHIDELIKDARTKVNTLYDLGFDKVLKSNKKYFDKVWEKSDIKISGDDLDQQGIRYCIFELEQTYHGYEEDNNIGAKGLTGEAYSGHAFWDSETYCLPYYLFSNKKAAMDLLMFRYNTLKEAKEKAKDLDCEGACYPIATRNGEEGCTLWQHASTQLQPSTAVAYAIFHYMNLYNDKDFMQNYGLEMLLEISKYLLSRGQYNPDHTKFSYYGVMGPDEFQVMVNHNTYTNFMAKKTFEYTMSLIDSGLYETKELFKKCGFTKSLIKEIKEADEKMLILYNKDTMLYEENAGFFDMPHIDINSIPVEDFPLYSHWAYDRIFRNDIIKQPDVLMFMFLYPSDFSKEVKEKNYDYYEPRCLHESSLSPSIHSIIASELGKEKEALDFFGFATRLDLDDYNRNTKEGLHTTSIAAAWMNIVYGFLGLRSDKELLSINPTLPSRWENYKVNINYHGTEISIQVTPKELLFNISGKPQEIAVYGIKTLITDNLKIMRPLCLS